MYDKKKKKKICITLEAIYKKCISQDFVFFGGGGGVFDLAEL